MADLTVYENDWYFNPFAYQLKMKKRMKSKGYLTVYKNDCQLQPFASTDDSLMMEQDEATHQLIKNAHTPTLPS